MIDSHVHLNDEAFYGKVDETVMAARAAGVTAFICVGFDTVTNRIALDIAHQYPFVYCTLGFHPSIAQNVTEKDLVELELGLEDPKVVAIGECGLDYYWDQTYKDIQHKIFQYQIELANKTKKPLIIHMRDASNDTLSMIRTFKHKDTEGVMHCYSGSVEMAHDFLKENLYISLAGPVTFKNAVTPKAVAAMVPSDRLLVETDSPYLAPSPNRGKPNSPVFLPLVLSAVATLRNMDLSEMDRITEENTRRLFKLPVYRE